MSRKIFCELAEEFDPHSSPISRRIFLAECGSSRNETTHHQGNNFASWAWAGRRHPKTSRLQWSAPHAVSPIDASRDWFHWVSKNDSSHHMNRHVHTRAYTTDRSREVGRSCKSSVKFCLKWFVIPSDSHPYIIYIYIYIGEKVHHHHHHHHHHQFTVPSI